MAGEERSVKVKIDNVRRVFNTRNGEMIALTVSVLILWKMNLSAWLVLLDVVNPHC